MAEVSEETKSRVKSARIKLNSTPWWRVFKRMDAATAYRDALLLAAFEEIDMAEVKFEERKEDPKEETMLVSWYDHDCPWISKYCEEHHVRYSVIPLSILKQYGVKE